MKITESQNGQIYPEDTFSHGAAHMVLEEPGESASLLLPAKADCKYLEFEYIALSLICYLTWLIL